MKEIISGLKSALECLEPYRHQAIKASSAYWELKEQIEKIEQLSFAFPSGADPGLTAKQYAAIQLRVPRSGDPDIDAMIRESRRAEFAGQALKIIIDKDMKFPDSLQHEDWMEYASTRSFEFADAMLAECW